MNAIVTTSNEITMSSLDFLNNFINPARKDKGENTLRHNELIRKIEDEIDENLIYGKSVDSRNRSIDVISLNYDQLMLVGMRESKFVRKSVLAKLKELSKPKEDPIVLLARQVLALDEENKRLAATKAQINDKRTATLMNKASQDAKRIKKLESQLQDVGDYRSVVAAGLPQRVETEVNPRAQTWRILVKISKDMGLPPKKVKDERYGEVNTYHIQVIERFKEDYIM